MNRTSALKTSIALAALLAGAGLATPSFALDADAAQALAKKNDCFKCHAVDKDKKGPSFKKISSKYKGKADAMDKLNKALTSSPKVKLDDGTEEEHKAIKADAAGIKNVSEWILAQ